MLNILVITKCKRTTKLLMFRSDLRKKEVYSKSATKTLYRKKVLVSECIFILVCYQRLVGCNRYRWNNFEQFVQTVAYLKKQPPKWRRRKGVLKNFTGKHLYWSLFLIKLQVTSQRWCFPLKFAKFLRTLIFKNTCIFIMIFM